LRENTTKFPLTGVIQMKLTWINNW